MRLLKKYIRKEIKNIFHEKTVKIPLILKSSLEKDLKLSPIGHYIKDILFPISNVPTYQIQLANDRTFEMIFNSGPNPTFIAYIENQNYDLLNMEEKALAQQNINNLLTGEKLSPTGEEDEEDITGDIDTGDEEETETEPEEEV